MENENWYVQWLKSYNLTRPEVFRRFGVPIRTQENWSNNPDSKPTYVFELLKFAFEHGYDRRVP